jgi:hypothetical protein
MPYRENGNEKSLVHLGSLLEKLHFVAIYTIEPADISLEG